MFIPLVPKTSYLGDGLLTPWGDWFEVTVIYFFFSYPSEIRRGTGDEDCFGPASHGVLGQGDS